MTETYLDARTAALTREVRNRAQATDTQEPYAGVVRLLLIVSLAMTAALAVGLLIQMLGETPGTNSYAVLADAFLNGHLYVTDCFDIDCAVYDGQQYIVFPPAPAVMAMPFVAVFGTSFAGFIALAAALSAASLVVWWRIFSVMKVERSTAIWLMLAIAVASPLYYVTVRGDGIWFIAQCSAFLFSSAAIWLAMERRSLVLAGAFIGIAFLSRQFAIFLLPFVYVMYLRADQKLIGFSRDHVMAVVKLALPVLAAIAIYMAYNYARFGDILDTGYAYIGTLPQDQTFISHRSMDIGLFSTDYIVFNLIHFFVQGFNVGFTGPYLTELGELDPLGTSILAASPFVLLAIFAPMRRPVVIGAITIVVMLLPMLFYHSNGFTQYNAQRYFLDWLPVLAVILALTIKTQLKPALALLVTYAIGLNAVTFAIAAFTTSAA